MTTGPEDRLRTLMATLAPEAPVTATEIGPVVRRDRVRRRTTVAAAGAGALVAAAVVVPVWLNRPGDGGVATATDRGPDPFSTLPCADLPDTVSGGFDAVTVTAARLCVAGDDFGFPYEEPPADALVTGLDGWAAALSELPLADPGRCAAIDVAPSPVRLLVEFSDGTRALVDTNMCGLVSVQGKQTDGDAVRETFLAALALQRESLPPPQSAPDAGFTCASSPTLPVPVASLVPPTAAWECPGEGARGPAASRLSESTELRLSELRAAVERAQSGAVQVECAGGAAQPQLVTLDAYGDVIRWESPCADGTWLTSGRFGPAAWQIALG